MRFRITINDKPLKGDGFFLLRHALDELHEVDLHLGDVIFIFEDSAIDNAGTFEATEIPVLMITITHEGWSWTTI
jgi:hypothetical protein